MTVRQLQELNSTIADLKLKKHSAVAFIFCEDNSLIKETVKYYRKRDFDYIFLFITSPTQYCDENRVLNFRFNMSSHKDVWDVINQGIPMLDNCWLYWGFNGEFFYYPYCESRTIHDLADFVYGEHRFNIFGSVIDLYTGDIDTHSDGVSMSNTYFDKINYYSKGAYYDYPVDIDYHEYERIRFLYGGLRWRYLELVPHEQRRIDRVPFFFVDNDLHFSDRGMTDRKEFHTYKCEHHYNPTCAVMSFHMARYFRHNHDTRAHVRDLMWDGAQRFRWNSSQLLRMGFIETGQWF